MPTSSLRWNSVPLSQPLTLLGILLLFMVSWMPVSVATASAASSSASSGPTNESTDVSEVLPCLDGWTAAPTALTASISSHVMCYRLYTPLDALGNLGQPADVAEATCQAAHPKGSLASAYSADQNEWMVLSLMLPSSRLAAHLRAQSQTQRGAVWLGGRFMASGRIGLWQGDAYLYNSTAFDDAAPSSPGWGAFSNWAVEQPAMSYGCVALFAVNDEHGGVNVAQSGRWIGEDCRATRPFVCSYVNDGSVFPATSTPEPTRNTTTTLPPDEYTQCVEGWTLKAAEGTCYRVWDLHSNPSGNDDGESSVSPATLQDFCEHILQPIDANAVHVVKAATITSVTQSQFLGSLVADISPDARALIGLSFIDHGYAGMYLDGNTSWVPGLAQWLWGDDEPGIDRGCVALDGQGFWHAVPCTATSATFACQYNVMALNVSNGTTPSTIGPSSTASPSSVVPLAERIASIAGAVHLVVASNTVGVYAVAGAGGPVDNLLLYWAPVSPYFTNPSTRAGAVLTAMPSLEHVLFSGEQEDYNSCAGHKKQEELSAVFGGKVTVHHRMGPEVGYVCVSENGKDYIPTRITYEVVEATIDKLVPVPSRRGRSVDGNSTWSLPPLFYSNRQLATMAESPVGIEAYTSAQLQVRLTAFARGRGQRSIVTHLRLSSTADCMGSLYTLLDPDLAVINVSSNRLPDDNEESNTTETLYAVAYQEAHVQASDLSQIHRLVDAMAETAPNEFYVCVAVEKRQINTTHLWGRNLSTTAGSEVDRLPADALAHFANASNPLNYTVARAVAYQRLLSARSIAVNPSAPTRIYTLVKPALKVHRTPPHASVRGMWILPPDTRFDESHHPGGDMRVELSDIAPVTGERTPALLSIGGNAAVPSSASLDIPPFASPVIVLDGDGLREGMVIALRLDPHRCSRAPGSDTAATQMPPATFDTMLPVSTVTVHDARGFEVSLSYVQLTLNVTGMWGLPPSKQKQGQDWYLCYASDTLSELIPLGLRVHVNPVNLTAITASPLEEGADGDDGSPPAGAGPHLHVSLGFMGRLRLWGLDTSHWSAVTLQHTQITFAGVLPGTENRAHEDEEAGRQCATPSLFHGQRSFGFMRATAAASTRATPVTDLVIPPGALLSVTNWSLRLCLSVPPPFNTPRRLFVPLAATVDVRPLEVMFIGPYGAMSSNHETLMVVSEDSEEVPWQVKGYGLAPGMSFFLSEEHCYGQPRDGPRTPMLVALQSRFNVSLTSVYDIPAGYRSFLGTTADPTAAAEADSLYMVLHRDTLTARQSADHVFGPTRRALHVCLHAPSTQEEVFPTAFKLVVRSPYVIGLRNVENSPSTKDFRAFCEDATSTEAQATCARLFGRVAKNQASEPSEASILYASSTDLLLEGFGLRSGETQLIPAVDCRNASTYLWRQPVPVSATPALSHNGSFTVDSTSRYLDPQASRSSWYVSLTMAETTRTGLAELPADGLLSRFVWCIRFRDSDADHRTRGNDRGSTSVDPRGFVSTGIPYHLVVPRVEGFLQRGGIGQRLVLPTQNATVGQWQKMQLVGKLIDHLPRSNPLYILLAPQGRTCREVHAAYIAANTTEDMLLFAVNGSTILMPIVMALPGSYRLCVSPLHPTLAAYDGVTESSAQMIALPQLRIDLYQPVYAVFSLNHTVLVTVAHGQEWALPVAGSELSDETIIRFRPASMDCGEEVDTTGVIPAAGLASIPLYTAPARPGDVEEAVVPLQHYVVLPRDLIQALPANHKYHLCHKVNRATPWAPSVVKLMVVEHIRRPTHFSYFSEADVVAVTPLAPTKVAMPFVTGEADTVNVVAALGEPISVMLWCRPVGACPPCEASESAASDSDRRRVSGDLGEEAEGSGRTPSVSNETNCTCPMSDTLCPSNRRVMFVRPLDHDGDPCFFDSEAVDSEVLRGPYTIQDGLLYIPANISGAAFHAAAGISYEPNMTQPWVMCLETGPERWREPTSPLVQLQITTAIPTGFRDAADNMANSSASFPVVDGAALGTGKATMTDAGRATLELYAGDSSQVFYLNGYGIRTGLMIRFGTHCEVNMTDRSNWESLLGMGTDADPEDTILTFEEAVAKVQSLSNIAHYTLPLRIERNDGVFLVPRSHQQSIDGAAAPMCLSHDGGVVYVRTPLSVRVLPPRYAQAEPLRSEDALEELLKHTLLVSRDSTGAVNLSSLGLSVADVPVGAQVLLSASCQRTTHDLPIINVSVPNTIMLTTAHTSQATSSRLSVCVRLPSTATPPDEADGDADESPDTGFQTNNVFFYVLPLSLGSVSVHSLDLPEAVREAGITQMVVRRGAEALLLPIRFAEDINDDSASDGDTSTEGAADVLLDMLSQSTALSFFSMARLAVVDRSSGQDAASNCANIREELDSSKTTVAVPNVALKAAFASRSVTFSSLHGDTAMHLIAPLPPHVAAAGETNSTTSPSGMPSLGSLCLSVDGGRHYMYVGVVVAETDWAPTLRVRQVAEDPQHRGDTIVRYQGSAAVAEVVDTRFEEAVRAADATAIPDAVHRFVKTLTTDAVWSGFVGTAGGFLFRRRLHLPAAERTDDRPLRMMTYATTVAAESDDDSGYNMGLNEVVRQTQVSCHGDTASPTAYARRTEGGRCLSIPHACGGVSLTPGATIRLVWRRPSLPTGSDTEAALCATAGTNFTTDVRVVDPRAWAGSLLVSDSSAVQIQLSAAQPYLADGDYALCVKRPLPYADASRQQQDAVYTAVSLTLRVMSGMTIARAARSAGGVIVVFQGTRATIPVEGTAVGVRRMPLLVSFAPVLGHAVSTVNTDPSIEPIVMISRGCAEVASLTDPRTGESRVNASGSLAVPEDVLMTMRWAEVGSGTLSIPPHHLQHLTNGTLYYLCYSVDGGLRFEYAGDKVAAGVITLAVQPPTVLGLAVNPHDGGAVAETLYTADGRFHYNDSTVSPAALRVQRLAPPPSQATESNGPHQQPEAVRLRYTTLFGNDTVLSRAPMYNYGATSAVIGNGIGQASGRRRPTSTSAAPTVPTLAASVAVLRSSLFGQVCAGPLPHAPEVGYTGSSTVGNNASGILAVPLFLLNLETGHVWSAADAAWYDTFLDRAPGAIQQAVMRMNPVLQRKDLQTNTARLLTAGGLSYAAVMGLAETVALATQRVQGEALVVCTSVDGINYYSANALLLPSYAELAEAVQPTPTVNSANARQLLRVLQLAVSAPVSAASSLAGVPTEPLYIRPDPTDNGSSYVSDLSMLLSMVQRPHGDMDMEGPPDDVFTSNAIQPSAAGIARLKDALALCLGVDAAVFVVHWQLSRAIAVPATDSGGLHRESLVLPTHALSISIASDAYQVNQTTMTRTLRTAPDILRQCVEVLRDNATRPALLSALLPVEHASAVSLFAVSMNFTFSNGMDLHAVVDDRSLVHELPPSESAWRTWFAKVPHNVSAAYTPDAENEDKTSTVTQWVVPLLLILSIGMGVAAYYVYKKFFAAGGVAASAVVVEASSTNVASHPTGEGTRSADG